MRQAVCIAHFHQLLFTIVVFLSGWHLVRLRSKMVSHWNSMDFNMMLIHLIKQFRSPPFCQERYNIWLFDEFESRQKRLYVFSLNIVCTIVFWPFASNSGFCPHLSSMLKRKDNIRKRDISYWPVSFELQKKELRKLPYFTKTRQNLSKWDTTPKSCVRMHAVPTIYNLQYCQPSVNMVKIWWDTYTNITYTQKRTYITQLRSHMHIFVIHVHRAYKASRHTLAILFRFPNECVR